jgi:hypothetical protein
MTATGRGRMRYGERVSVPGLNDSISASFVVKENQPSAKMQYALYSSL